MSIAWGCLGLALGLASLAASPPHPTFTRDVAPIVFAHCTPCHHDGGAGPFSLTSYADVRKRARQIARLTRARVMPPWPPVSGHGRFKGERRLDDGQIATLGRWAAQGAIEGDLHDLPPKPSFTRDWQLGAPDLVLTAASEWTLPAEGDDVFRNFVLPVRARRTPLRARDRDPSRQRAHRPPRQRACRRQRHGPRARRRRSRRGVRRDGSRRSRRSGSSLTATFCSGSPARRSRPTDTIPWTLDPGTDLILNLHLRPSGKPEAVRPSIGLHFTDQPPTRFPMLLQLEHDGAIDIPAGASRFAVTDYLDASGRGPGPGRLPARTLRRT